MPGNFQDFWIPLVMQRDAERLGGRDANFKCGAMVLVYVPLTQVNERHELTRTKVRLELVYWGVLLREKEQEALEGFTQAGPEKYTEKGATKGKRRRELGHAGWQTGTVGHESEASVSQWVCVIGNCHV